jgi:RNA polymerase sigma factor FliA
MAVKTPAARLASRTVAGAQDGPDVRERFNAELELVDVLARQIGRTLGRGFELDDLLAYGREGLLDAARRFEPSRGVPFRAYATIRVRGAIIDGVRQMARLPRRIWERLSALQAANEFSAGALEDALGPPPPGARPADAERALDDHLAGMATAMAMGMLVPRGHGEDGGVIGVDGDDPESVVARAELLELATRGIDELPQEEAELLRRHYLGGEQLLDVAQELGLSKSWASRIHTRALGRLTKRLRPAVR